MMNDERLELHQMLSDLFPEYMIYFRPSSKLILQYPCVVYDVSGYKASTANNKTYTKATRFQIKVLSIVPGVKNANKLLDLNARHITSYITEDIVNDIFELSLRST